MFPSAVIDGEDLVLLSRASPDSGDQHDADLSTIHRVNKFRTIAMDLHRDGLHKLKSTWAGPSSEPISH